MMARYALFIFGSVLFGACARSHAPVWTAGDAGDSDGAPPPCSSEAAWGDLGQFSEPAVDRGGVIGWGTTLSARWYLDLGLSPRLPSSVFPSGQVTPGTFSLADEPTGWSACSVCVEIRDPLDTTGSRDCYWATAGEVVLTSTVDRLTGSLNHVVLRHYYSCPFGAPPVPAGTDCQTVASLSFDAPIYYVIGGP